VWGWFGVNAIILCTFGRVNKNYFQTSECHTSWSTKDTLMAIDNDKPKPKPKNPVENETKAIIFHFSPINSEMLH